MSKSELKRLCTQNPVEMAKRIEELESIIKELRIALETIVLPNSNSEYFGKMKLDEAYEHIAYYALEKLNEFDRNNNGR